MSANIVIVVCAQALLANIGLSQCIRSGVENGCGFIAPPNRVSPCGLLNAHVLAGDGFSFGSGLGITGAGLGILPTGGGAFAVSSVTPIPPKGITVESENIYEGALGVFGELPFLSTVGFEGVLPSAGAGFVNHGYGNGITAITGEIGNSAGITGVGGISSGIIGAGGIGSGIIGAGGIGSGIISAGGIGSGIIGAGGIGSGIGSGAFGYGLGSGGISYGINGHNFERPISNGCGCGW